MHAPDGFLTAGTAVATGILSGGTVAVAVRRSREQLTDAQVPLAGLAAAFVFAAQMIMFPVLPGVAGHLMGGALAAVLLGPIVGALVVTVVVVVQALVFADGGLTALGYNTMNMALVTAFGGWAVFRLAMRVLPASRRGVVAAAAIAAWASVVLSALAFSLQWLFGASVPIAFDRFFGLMVGVHALIGIGEAVITGGVVAAVLAARPDLVRGARDLGLDRPARTSDRRFLAAGLIASALVAVGIVQFAVDAPDGLEYVAEETGMAEAEREHRLESSVFADYATAGIENDAVSVALAGGAGTLLTLVVGGGLFLALRDRRRDQRVSEPV